MMALILRLNKLSILPVGFHVDEVKIGWNAYSLLKTGHDDWGHAFPVHYNTFGDFRPAGFIYAAVPSIAIFGLTEFAVRFPPAIFGSISVLVLFYLAKAITHKTNISLLSSFLMGISPWNIAMSRSSSEAVISLTLTMIGLTFFIVSIKNHKTYQLILSGIFLSFSYFFYHTFRLLTPPVIAVIWMVELWPKNIKKILNPHFMILILLSLLTLGFILNPNARGRFSQVSIFNDQGVQYELQKLPFEEGNNHVLTARIFHNKLVIYSIRYLTEYFRYFSSDYLVGSWGAKPLRYVTVNTGPLLYLEFIVVIFGLVALVKTKTSPLLFLFLVLAPAIAALTTEDTPNLSRSLFMNPLLCIIGGFGSTYLFKIMPGYKKIIIFLLFLNFVYFWHMYSVHNSGREVITMNRNSGVKELINQVFDFQKKYSAVYLTNIPDSLYPWYAFYSRTDPEKFNSAAKNRDQGAWKYQNVVFSEFKCPSNNLPLNSADLVLVDSEGCPDQDKLIPIGKITRTSDGIAYKIWGRK